MYLNRFAETLAPTDMTASDEFASLRQSAADLGIPHGPDVRYASRQTVVRGLRFHFLDWGPSGPAAQPQGAEHQGRPGAPPVLLLHGGNQSAHSWDLVSLHLADRFHVLALDQRGHGDSEWSREIDYSTEAKADDALAFVADQGLDRPIVMGHSMGGMVSMRMALSQPDVMRALVLVDVGPELSDKGVGVVRDFVVRNVEFDDLDEFLDNVVRYDRFRSREHIARTVKYNMLRRADGKYVSKVDHRRVPATPGAPPSLEELAAVSCPVLLVRGAESDVLEADAAERFVAALPNGTLVTVPKAGHNVHGANTPGFLEAVNPFLAAVA
ncbi:MAG: alpha/beta hydrolase [Acidimicrobiaceae bacterium]|nr:alpha/beta hydrolase [Acidimicrobiaceae bacterium]